jgi:membrane associated rhomboid family serine protease
MILPIHTSIRPRQIPYVNYALIAINAICFLMTYFPHYSILGGSRVEEPLREWARQFMLTPARPLLWQFVTYGFLHSGYAHIIGNMFFLYLFGNNVNDRLGGVNYLCLYLGGAVFAAIGHVLLHSNPVLGASGAVAAVTGAYLVLFPQTLVTVLYWFIIIGTMEISALYFIGFKLIFWDNILEPRFSSSAVAYDAHLAGFAFGILTILSMLATGLISSSQFDLWSMAKRWNQRRRYKTVVAGSQDTFVGDVKTKQIEVKEVETAVLPQENEETRQLRNEIGSLIAQRSLPLAAQKYLELVAIDSCQVLPCQQLLDIANQLASENKHSESAQAYEIFLEHYGNYEYAEQVRLMLGLLYARYLHQSESAVKYLKAAAEKLTNPGQLKMCNDELAKLQN